MLDHRWDLVADFRAIYRLSPAEALALPGPEFMALAWRLPAYRGALRQHIENRQEAGRQAQDAGVERVSPDRESIEAAPADIAGLFDWG